MANRTTANNAARIAAWTALWRKLLSDDPQPQPPAPAVFGGENGGYQGFKRSERGFEPFEPSISEEISPKNAAAEVLA